jgi:hypothetical protein
MIESYRLGSDLLCCFWFVFESGCVLICTSTSCASTWCREKKAPSVCYTGEVVMRVVVSEMAVVMGSRFCACKTRALKKKNIVSD